MGADTCVVHAYGVVEAANDAPMPESGVLGAQVERVPCGDHDVIASVLPEASFGPRSWQAHGQDPEWLAPVARQHHEVLQHLVERTDVVPLRLPGIFPDTRILCAAVSAMADQLSTAMQVVRGNAEWTVKVWRENVVELPGQAPPPATGAEYLRRRSAQAAERDRRNDQAGETALAVHEHLATVATHAVMNPLQGREVTGRREVMVLNAAYLVGRGVQEEFFAAADRQADLWGPQGFVVEVTGPWPAYSFTSVRLEQVPAS